MKLVPWLLMSIWCSACLVGLMLFSQLTLKEFDPNLRLADAARNMAFEQHLRTLLGGAGVSPKSAVIHFSQQGCLCARVSRSHINRVATEAERRGLANTTIDLSDTQHRFNFIPSTPAVAVFDGSGRLNYLGPYGEGYSCLSASLGIDTVLFDRTPDKTMPQAVIVTEANGCYCEV